MNIIKEIEDFCWYCYRTIRDFVFEPVWYRFFGHKHHIVNTNLPPSSWYDTDTRMLYSVMSLVEWFVENDMTIWSINERKLEIERINKEENNDCKQDIINHLNAQWANEDEIMEIYRWWKNYPNRQRDIRFALHDWCSYVESFQKDKDDFIEFFNVKQIMNEEQKKNEEALGNKHKILEAKLVDEEQEMLKKAIDLRSAMWS